MRTTRHIHASFSELRRRRTIYRLVGKKEAYFVSIARAAKRDAREQEADALKAFFLGKAVAELALEGIGNALGDALSLFGASVAETDERMDRFRKEVIEKAEMDLQEALKTTTPEQVEEDIDLPPVDLVGAISELRSEISSARQALLALREAEPDGGTNDP